MKERDLYLLSALAVVTIVITTGFIVVSGESNSIAPDISTTTNDHASSDQRNSAEPPPKIESTSESPTASTQSHAPTCVDGASFMNDLERLSAFGKLDSIGAGLERLRANEMNFYTGKNWSVVVVMSKTNECVESIVISCEFKDTPQLVEQFIRDTVVQCAELLAAKHNKNVDFSDFCKVGTYCDLEKNGVRVFAELQSTELWSVTISAY